MYRVLNDFEIKQFKDNGAIVVKNIIDKNILKTIVRKFQNVYSNQTKIQDSYDNLINYLD